MLILIFLVAVLHYVFPLPLAQRMLRAIWRQHPPANNPFVSLIETPLFGDLVAYTAEDRTRMFVDTRQLDETPNTLWNVLRHELGHTQGQEHGANTTEMRYHVTKDPQGRIINDAFRI